MIYYRNANESGFRQKINLRQGKKGVYAEGLNLVSVENAADVENLVKREIKIAVLDPIISMNIVVVVI